MLICRELLLLLRKKNVCIFVLLYLYLRFVLMLNWHSFPVNGFDNLLPFAVQLRVFILAIFTPFFHCSLVDKKKVFADKTRATVWRWKTGEGK